MNITLAGGNTMFEGIKERLQKEIEFRASKSASLKVWAPPNRNLSTWLGASCLASLSSFTDMWITKAEYEEHGVSIVHKKCV